MDVAGFIPSDPVAGLYYGVATGDDSAVCASLRLAEEWDHNVIVNAACVALGAGNSAAFEAIVGELRFFSSPRGVKTLRSFAETAARNGDLVALAACDRALALAGVEEHRKVLKTVAFTAASTGDAATLNWCMPHFAAWERGAIVDLMKRAGRCNHPHLLDCLLPLADAEAPSAVLASFLALAERGVDAGVDAAAVWCLSNGADIPDFSLPGTIALPRLQGALVRLFVLRRLAPEARAAEVEKWRASVDERCAAGFAFAD